MASQCPTYQNVSVAIEEQSPYQIVEENAVQRANEYADLNDNTGSSCTTISSKSGKLPKRFVPRIHYTDVLLDSPDVPASNEITLQENDVLSQGVQSKSRPAPPPKPRKSNKSHTTDERDKLGIEMAGNKRREQETESVIDKEQGSRSRYWKHIIILVLFILVIVAIVIGISAAALAILNFIRYQSCQKHSVFCTIDAEVNTSCAVHSDFNFKLTRLNSHCEYSSRLNLDLYVIATLHTIQEKHYCTCLYMPPGSAVNPPNTEINCTLVETVCV